jgi:hypothetical protein
MEGRLRRAFYQGFLKRSVSQTWTNAAQKGYITFSLAVGEYRGHPSWIPGGAYMMEDLVLKNRSYRRFYQDHTIVFGVIGELIGLEGCAVRQATSNR